MTRTLAVVALLLVGVLTSGVVEASEQSKLLYSRGLVEFHADRFQAALDLFNQAVAADETDVYARYYRAVTRGRLNDLEGAIGDLRAVLVAKPDLDQAALDLGVALVQTRKYREAIPYLQQAQRVPDLEGNASQFLGVAYLRLGELDEARDAFRRAAAHDPQQLLVSRYYEGVVEFQQGNLLAAEDRFAYVVKYSPESEIGTQAAAFIQKLHELEPARYETYGEVGFQYDSNVILAQSQSGLNDQALTDLGVSQQDDERVTIAFGGIYVPYRTPRFEVSVAYDFYQSLHFHLTGFNIQDHGPSLQLAANNELFRYGIVGRYDYYLLESDSFLQEGTAMPWLTVPETDFGRTELFFRLRRRDFKDPDFAVRDGFNYAVSGCQYVYLDGADRYLFLGYQWDRDNPIIAGHKYSTRTAGVSAAMFADEAYSFGYDGNEVRTGVGWLLPYDIRSETTLVYRRERYKPQSDGRRDDEEELLVELRRPISNHWDVVGGYFGDFNNSSNPQFDYDRSIVSLALEARF